MVSVVVVVIAVDTPAVAFATAVIVFIVSLVFDAPVTAAVDGEDDMPPPTPPSLSLPPPLPPSPPLPPPPPLLPLPLPSLLQHGTTAAAKVGVYFLPSGVYFLPSFHLANRVSEVCQPKNQQKPNH